MAEPSEKGQFMESFLDAMTLQTFGKSRTECIKSDICVMCHGAAKEFSNSLSVKEYSISGMCQKCQDETYGG